MTLCLLLQKCDYRYFFPPTTAGDDGSASISTRDDGSISPTSLASTGATSLNQQDEDGASSEGAAKTDAMMEASCRELLSLVEELTWHHAQIVA